jgi:hypothetical protein
VQNNRTISKNSLTFPFGQETVYSTLFYGFVSYKALNNEIKSKIYVRRIRINSYFKLRIKPFRF